MKRRILVLVVAVLTAMPLSLVASADTLGPCNDSGEPGNSDYARHHIVELAKAGALGAGGHQPGVLHQGFSSCP